MKQRNETFGRLLKAGIASIANCEGKTAAVVEEQLGAASGVSGDTIQRYKSGALPPEPRTIQILATAAVQRGFMGREWLQRFLHAAHYPQAEALLEQLCPAPQVRPRPPRVYANLPAPSYSQFVMRAQAFAEILDGLRQRSAAVLIIGMGGNGKTSLAREIASACLQEDDVHAPRFDAAVWVSDKDQPGTTNLSIVLDTIARTLDYPGFTQFAHSEKQHEVEQLLRRQRVLLIVDNFETITDGALLTWLLRLPEPSKALITSREYSRAFRNSTIVVELRGMTVEEVQSLMTHRLRILRIDQHVASMEQLDPLIVATGGNPKAIEITLGLIKYERRPLPQIVDDLYAARGEIFTDLFERAWALLDEAARRVLMVATFFPTNASGAALSASADVQGFAFDRAIERLADMALIDVQITALSSPPRYALHPLVRAFSVIQMLNRSSFEIEARERWLTWYKHLAMCVGECWNDLSKLELLDDEHETLYASVAWAYANGHHRETMELVKECGYFFYVRGIWDKISSLDFMYAQAAHHLSDPIEELNALANMVQILSHQDRLAEAAPYISIMEALACSESIPADVNYEYQHARSLYWTALGHIDKAIEALQSSLIHQDKLSSYFFIANQQWLATRLSQFGKLTEAKSLFQTTLNNAIEHRYERGIIACQIGLAMIELREGLLDRAEQLITDSVERATRHRDKRYLAEAKRSYAHLQSLLGKHETAYIALTEAIDLFERMGMRRELAEAHQALRELDAESLSATPAVDDE